jgi:2-deoxy-D-gluconate 3-dehydrogenase
MPGNLGNLWNAAMKLFDLTGKTAIVTGGNGGIGLGIAQGLSDAGANLVILGRNDTKNQHVVEHFVGQQRPCLGLTCDVAIKDDIDRCVAAALAEFSSIDILVNNAGIAGGGPPESMSDDIWDQVLDVNLKSVLRFSQAVHPHMKAAGGGKIINIGSMYSIFGSADVSPYSASKGGVIQLTKSLAIAWARHNIQVNTIVPGWISTEMTAPVMENKAFFDMIIARTPEGRFGQPEEFAGAAVYLASAASNFVTGISLPVDGGYSIT